MLFLATIVDFVLFRRRRQKSREARKKKKKEKIRQKSEYFGTYLAVKRLWGWEHFNLTRDFLKKRVYDTNMPLMLVVVAGYLFDAVNFVCRKEER